MPRIEYRRRDLTIIVDRQSVGIIFEKISHSISTAPEASRVVRAITETSAWKKWMALAPADSTLSRICLDIRDCDRQEEDWESCLASELHDSVKSVVLLRTTPVRPRCANFPFAVPLRFFHINARGANDRLTALEHKHRGKVLTEYEEAFVTTKRRWDEWNEASMPQDWPNVDVLHIAKLPSLAKDWKSTDATQVGTLGWITGHVLQWQVRLLIIQTEGADALKNMRSFAAAIVARGGPAIVVEAFRPALRREFYRVFYRELIHDRPIDLIWQTALIETNATNGSLFAGATREEQLRISSVAVKIPAEMITIRPSTAAVPATPLKGWSEIAQYLGRGVGTIQRWEAFGLPVRRPRSKDRSAVVAFRNELNEWLKPATEGRFPSFGKLARGKKAAGTARFHTADVPLKADFPGIPKINAADLINFQHESAFLNISRHVSRLRGPDKMIISPLEARWTPRLKKAARFCNVSFWRESVKGQLNRIDQSNGVFLAGILYHLGVQIGPKDVRIFTVNHKEFLEEVLKWTPDMEGMWIEIGITGVDFEVVGDPVQRLWLPREGPSEATYFAIVPRRNGASRLRFALYYEQNVIQSFRVAVIVGPRVNGNDQLLAAALDLAPEDAHDFAWLPVLEFSLPNSIEAFAADTKTMLNPRAVSIVANDWNGDSVITVKGASGFGVNVASGRLTIEVQDLRDLLVEISGLPDKYPFDAATNAGRPEQLEGALRSLADHGSKLFAELFDGSLWKGLRDCLNEPDQTIQVAQVIREKVIPWSFIYGRALKPRPGDRDKTTGKLTNIPVCLAGLPDLNGNLTVRECGASPRCRLRSEGLPPENVVCPLHFWGYRHVIEVPPQQVVKRAETPDESRGIRTEILVDGAARFVAGLNATFDSESAHMQRVENIESKIPIKPEREFTAAGILGALAKVPIHLAYFFCHASGGKGSSDSMLIFQAAGQDSERIPWQDFAQLRDGELWQPPALVFLNGCRTVAYSPEALSGFLRAFVDQLGASGLIGTEISVFDVFAAEIAERFLEEFFNCEPAGPALLKARRTLLAKNNPLGLVYVLFAWSGLCLVRQ